jgi:hypothetical protein
MKGGEFMDKVFLELSLLTQNYEELEILDISKVYTIGFTMNYRITRGIHNGYYTYTIYPQVSGWEKKLWKTIGEKIEVDIDK